MADYIEREVLLNKLKERDICLCVTEWDIKEAPAADVAPVRHGKWEFRQSEKYKFCTDAVCTACNTAINSHHENNLEYRQTAIKEQLRYCPKCGARMDLEEPND